MSWLHISAEGPVSAPGQPVGRATGKLVTVPVAVIIPSYRRKEYLERALASVASQEEVKPAEVIVVDDGSGDGTAELAAARGARVIVKGHNEGLSAARDDGLRAAEGAEWLALLDDDDQWLPHHLATVWSKRGDHVLVSGTSLTFGGDVRRAHGCLTDAPEVISSPSRLVFPENSVTTSASLVRRDILLAVGGFDRVLRHLEDLDAWLRVLERGTGLLLPDLTCLYRVHTGQLSQNRDAMLAAQAGLMDKYRDRLWMSSKVREGLDVVDAWDGFQGARAAKEWAEAARQAQWLVSRPARATALAETLRFRRRVRRRSKRLAAAFPSLTSSRASDAMDGTEDGTA